MSADTPRVNALYVAASPIMRPESFNRAENCADVAIPLLSSGGARAVSAGVLAGHLRVTPAAVLKWFGSTAEMWHQLADAIGRRWYSCLSQASRLQVGSTPLPLFAELDVFEAVSLFLPLNDDEVEWTRVWLTLLEHGRHNELTGGCLATWESQELEALYRATGCRDTLTLTSSMVVVRGLRQMVTSTHEPLDLDTAHLLLRRHVSQVYVEGGIPEPASEADALPASRRMTFFPALPRG